MAFVKSAGQLHIFDYMKLSEAVGDRYAACTLCAALKKELSMLTEVQVKMLNDIFALPVVDESTADKKIQENYHARSDSVDTETLKISQATKLTN